ncbi:MAG: hypothetical protein DIU80_020845 [Chloroflexota bacterium]|mgnify:CR=1 FL=1
MQARTTIPTQGHSQAAPTEPRGQQELYPVFYDPSSRRKLLMNSLSALIASALVGTAITIGLALEQPTELPPALPAVQSKAAPEMWNAGAPDPLPELR